MSSDDTEEALFFALLLREASVFVALFVSFFFFRLFFFPCICAFACEPTKQQRENENTEETRFSASLVLPLKQCHRNSLPSSFIVQTRLLFFFSFQILRQTLLLLKAAKESPFARYGKNGEF